MVKKERQRLADLILSCPWCAVVCTVDLLPGGTQRGEQEGKGLPLWAAHFPPSFQFWESSGWDRL